MLDLDPSSSVGVRTNTLRFIRLLASYFVMTPALHPEDVEKVMTRADEMNENVAIEQPDAHCQYEAAARAMLQRLERYANQIQLGPEYQEEIQDLEERVDNPFNTLSARLMTHVSHNSLAAYALKRAKRYQDSALQTIRPFKGFNNKRNLSAEELKAELFSGSWMPDSGLQ